LTKEQAVPPLEISLALERKNKFLKNPARHTLEERI
jgi:hypothetical protein